MLEIFNELTQGLTPMALLLIISILLGALYIAWRRKTTADLGQNAPEVSRYMETAALFQAMRDLVQDQKRLAKAFNQTVEKKVAVIREVAKLVADEHENLLRANADLSQRLTQAQQDIERLETRAALPKQKSATDAPAQALTHVVVSPNLSALRAIALPPSGADSDELIDTWVGLDFGGDEAGPDDGDEGLARPEGLNESGTGLRVERNEFRSLLNMGFEDFPANTAANSDMETLPDTTASVRARTYKYFDAGMTVAQIAHEIGVGKGEVKLILSLRDRDK